MRYHGGNYEQIEVFGRQDKRVQVVEVETKHGPSKTLAPATQRPKRHFITHKKQCPVANPFQKDPNLSREVQIRKFDELLWNEWHARDAMPPAAKEWFQLRLDEYKAGHEIDLVCDCRDYSDEFAGLVSSWRKPGCHGYSLRDYIKYLAGEEIAKR